MENKSIGPATVWFSVHPDEPVLAAVMVTDLKIYINKSMAEDKKTEIEEVIRALRQQEHYPWTEVHFIVPYSAQP